MNNQPIFGKWHLTSLVQLLNTKQDINRREKAWAKLNLPRELIQLKSGFFLPVNHRTMPLGFNESGKCIVQLESFQTSAVHPDEVYLEALDDLKLYSTKYPWEHVQNFREYKACLNELLGYPGHGINVFG